MSRKPNIRLALVDDGLPLRKLMSLYLSSRGFVITHEAGDGVEFLAQLALAPLLPEICLLDSQMPNMDGLETARRLTRDYPSILILGYSFLNDPASTDRILASGAHDSICKDAPASEIKDALLALYDSRHPLT